METTLPNDTWLHILHFCSPCDLVRLEATSTWLQKLPTDSVWQRCCQRHPFHHYFGEDPEENNLPEKIIEEKCDIEYRDWKERYRFYVEDAKRTEMTLSDLESLEWRFTFLNVARARNLAATTLNIDPNEQSTEVDQVDQEGPMSACYFIDGNIYILEYLERFGDVLPIEFIEYHDAFAKVPEHDEALIISNMLLENLDWLDEAIDGLESSRFAQSSASLSSKKTAFTPYYSSSTTRWSYKQCFRIADFALHSVARKPDGNWLIWNKHVALGSYGKRKNDTRPLVLEKHLKRISQT